MTYTFEIITFKSQHNRRDFIFAQYPSVKVKGRRSDDSKWFYCGNGIAEIRYGHHKFDINIQEDSASYWLYWTEH